jgi:PAS domain S-box-containing protein
MSRADAFLARVGRRGRWSAVEVAVLYALAGLLWILVSDRVVETVVADPALAAHLQTLKGGLFVLASAIVVYFLTERALATARRSAAAASESERFLASLLSSLPGFAYRCKNDPTWTMEVVTDGCADLTGYAPAAFMAGAGRSYADVIHPDDRDGVWTEVQEALARGTAFQLTYRITTAEGAQKWVWEQGRGVRSDDGEVRTIEGLILDITERKQLEDQLRQAQKMEALGQLSAGVAHDFRNALSVMLGNLQLLRDALPADATDVQDALEDIEGAAHSSTALIQRLLAFSRLAELSIQPVVMGAFLSDLASVLRTLLPDNVSVRVEPDPLGSVARLDAHAMQQVFMNLAANARDAMPDGGRLDIRTERVTLDEEARIGRPWVTPGDYVCVSVRDTGEGMDPQTLARMGEPMFTTKPPGKGTGLGIPMVFGLMKQHGGFAHVYSERGRGTTVRLYFPVAGERPVAHRQDRQAPATIPGGTETILVVEDLEPLRRVARRILEKLGYTVLEAADGEEALAIVRAHHHAIDLIVSDLSMPKLGGMELRRRLQQEQATVRFLFSSGYAQSAADAPLEPTPAVPFLLKPWTVPEVARKVREVLDAPAG